MGPWRDDQLFQRVQTRRSLRNVTGRTKTGPPCSRSLRQQLTAARAPARPSRALSRGRVRVNGTQRNGGLATLSERERQPVRDRACARTPWAWLGTNGLVGVTPGGACLVGAGLAVGTAVSHRARVSRFRYASSCRARSVSPHPSQGRGHEIAAAFTGGAPSPPRPQTTAQARGATGGPASPSARRSADRTGQVAHRRGRYPRDIPGAGVAAFRRRRQPTTCGRLSPNHTRRT